MARTPLMHGLQKLAREHQAADRLGITPAELRERQAAAREHHYSRGEFLKRSGAIGAAVRPATALPIRTGANNLLEG